MKIDWRPAWVAFVVCFAMLAAPLAAQIGSLTCSSNDGRCRYCRADTQNKVRLVRQLSKSRCDYRYSWGYDYRGIWMTAEDMAAVALPNAKIRTYSDDNLLFDDLIQGKLEAAVADSPRPEIVAKLYPTNVICVCDTPLATYPAAFAVRRGNLEFVNFLNSWIEARTANKWLEERRTYWFKTTDWAKDL